LKKKRKINFKVPEAAHGGWKTEMPRQSVETRQTFL
jgi:hypothetical protein